SRPTSSVPAGTVLTGLNFLKDGKDPVALPDSEYPSWLWSLLDPPKRTWTEEEKLTDKKYLKHVRKEKIRLNNFLRGKK
ncbi:mitochondrial ribosomal protein L37-domain-containing protein, partial [Paraphysoderma sedebokerense]